MRSALRFLFLSAVLASVVVSCDDGGGPSNPNGGGNGAEPYFPADYLQTYTLVRDCRFSIPHDGTNITVHASPEAADAYVNGNYPFPEGSILVKTLHSDANCQNVAGYVVMRKGAPGTAPASGDWEWQELERDRTVTAEGVLQQCISCHEGCTEGRDYTCTDP